MHAIRTTNRISEDQAAHLIFDACRANEKREPKGNVTFHLLANGEHEATLRDDEGVVIAQAFVDWLDC